MTLQRVRVPTKAWYGDEELELSFPDGWDVTEHRMAGHDASPLSDDEIRRRLEAPIGSAPLRTHVQGKRQAVILFDDLTRPAPTAKILPLVLEELHKAGMADDQIRFVAAFGNHAPMDWEALAKKLGADVVRRYRVYNHNPYEFLVDLGKTSRGTPILVNREVMACDLRIGIGGLIPHRGAGFGGGAKLVFPGVCGILTADHNHRVLGGLAGDKSAQKNLRLGEEVTEVRLDIEEAVRTIGLDFKIDLLVNNRREIVGVYAGDFVAQHRAGLEAAKRLYATPVAEDCDIVVANAYPIENQPLKGVWPGNVSLRDGGILVLIAQCPEGIAHHYLASRHGTAYGGTLWAPPAKPLVAKAKLLVCLSPYMSRVDLDTLGPPDMVLPCSSWGEVMIPLMRAYPGRARVAVYPYTAIQMPGDTAR